MKQLIITLLLFSVAIAVSPGRLEGSSYTYRVQRAIVDETMKISRDYRLKKKLKNLEAALRIEAARQQATRLAQAQDITPARSRLSAGAVASGFQANAATIASATAGSS